MHFLKKKITFIIPILFFIILISQIFLKNPYIKTKMSRLYEYEAKYVYSEQNIGKAIIQIKISKPSDNLFLLQNGEKVAVLNKELMNIEIYDNSVIEIDGRRCDEEVNVEICSLPENIEGFYECNIIVSSKIVVLGRFFIK